MLSDLAQTLTTDFPIQGILDHLVQRIVAVLPVTGAGVTLLEQGAAPFYVAALDPAALRYERLQTQLREGPCVTAFESGEAVAVPDLATDDRYPSFRPAAVAAGMAAVFTFPLRHGTGRLGALDLYRDTAGELGPADLAAGQTLADVAAAYLLNARAREEALEVSNRFRDSSLHDALTGLPNRGLLRLRLEHAAQRARRSHSTAAVLFVDLDRFKSVNDRYGHAAGDELLVAVASRLAGLVRPGDTLARVSGDEFVILCEELAEDAVVDRLVARIGEAFTVPFQLLGVPVEVTASVGVAYAGPGEDVTGQLVTDADLAMYEAKRARAGASGPVDLLTAQAEHDRSHLEQDLRAALSTPELDLAYQPIVCSADGLVTGVEALLRWTHPRRGPVPALTAISVAEQSGLINDLGSWVLDRACRDRVTWLEDHPDRPLELSVNVSARQLTSPGFRDLVAGVLTRTGMDPAALVLEVTESVFMVDGERSGTVLRDLKALGVRLALDDFGTGCSSLSYLLRRYPIDIIKIDRTFVANLSCDLTAAAVVGAMIDLSHVLGMSVTAEGVETQLQHDELRELDCESAQGFRYAHPMPAPAVAALLESAPPHTPLRLPTCS